ncbi:intradiol ring-cleavage dioxygenase [Polaromonas jejuensis]|uniref:Intradiol ring-cleavage dioxygenase n=1 Tax=Polaromonas jejuensis TaxID=457502 RepID=A0ABW0Q4E4_9BURK|nr:intradiol ring-cleavage dioxygenase [Polaromonas jejuensis]
MKPLAPSPQNTPALHRRHWLAFGVASAGAAGLATSGTNAATDKVATASLPLTAQATEGPYYFDAGKVRADITEGLAGVPLEVRFTVMDASAAPLPNMRVDIWHCNAAGLYSGYAGQGDQRSTSTKGSSFLRGTLITGADGMAAFRSIYPGWYEGRTTHIHFKVLSGARTLLTSQFFLPDALSEFLYTSLPDYRRTHLRETLNRNDGIALMAGSTVLGAVREEADRYVAMLNVVVDPLARQLAGRPPVPGEGPPPGAGGPGRGKALTAAERLAALVPGKPKN